MLVSKLVAKSDIIQFLFSCFQTRKETKFPIVAVSSSIVICRFWIVIGTTNLEFSSRISKFREFTEDCFDKLCCSDSLHRRLGTIFSLLLLLLPNGFQMSFLVAKVACHCFVGAVCHFIGLYRSVTIQLGICRLRLLVGVFR